MSVRIEGLTKSYVVHRRRAREEQLVALEQLDLEVADGELLVVVGPSGSGKSTLLRCIAGLEPLDRGRIWVGDREVTALEPGARDVAMVFQEYALFPHMTVADNITFGLRARKTATSQIDLRLQDAASALGLGKALDRYPSELSGGERQRVALARSIVRDPKVFLLDEPLSNLDAELRTRTRAEIRNLQHDLGTTMVYVTHDQVEAMTMGDRIVVLRDGRLEQIGTPRELYESPATGFVARFLGMPPMNLFPAELLGREAGWCGLRPEDVTITAPSEGRLTGRVVSVELLGAEGLVHVEVDRARILVREAWNESPERDSEVGLAFRDDDLHRFEDRDGPAL